MLFAWPTTLYDSNHSAWATVSHHKRRELPYLAGGTGNRNPGS